LSSGNRISGFHQLIVQPGLVHDFARMPNKFPDLGEDHRLLRVIFPDLLVLLPKLLRHRRHLRV
jgi:hypothetical protein